LQYYYYYYSGRFSLFLYLLLLHHLFSSLFQGYIYDDVRKWFTEINRILLFSPSFLSSSFHFNHYVYII
jgi:hypothetical protein